MMNQIIPVIAIVGPTAIGKSQLALRLAQHFNGEIVSADSRQVYHHMDIGTAKPSRQELSLVSHHLIDIINPDEDFSLALYQQLAYQAINDIQKRGKLPIIVGGSGLYVQAVLEGWGIPRVGPDPEFRRGLEERAARGEIDELYQELANIDPAAAQNINRHNIRRVIRALEVSRSGQAPFSKLQRKTTPPFNSLIIGLTTERNELYRRIDARVDRMIETGLITEVEKLLASGFGTDLPSMSGIGYKQIAMFIKDDLSLEAAIYQIKTDTHRLARRQYNWFKLDDERIHWFDIKNDIKPEVFKLVAGHLSG